MRRSAGSARQHRTRSLACSSIFRRSWTIERRSMNAPLMHPLEQERIVFKLNGREVDAFAGETIIEAADRLGVAIPRLCYKPGMRPDGNCRACMVEIKGERLLAPSCCRRPGAGMEVASDSARALHAQKMIIEMLAGDMPAKAYRTDSELAYWQRALGVGKPRFDARAQPAADLSHPAMAVNLDACIQCTRCVRACREEQVNDVIGYACRGAHSEIVFDLGDPMGESTCVACGECVQACPTGALAPAHDAYLVPTDRRVASLCPYCGVGCQLTYHVADNRIVRVEGRDGPANHDRLCVKGRFGFDYAHHPQRLTKPLIRKSGFPKSADFVMDPANPLAVFREASWEEALDLAGGTLKKIREQRGAHALAGFGSAKGSNEEAYLFQKLVRTGFGSNNVDHCTRLCHASSVVALLEGIGSGAVSNPVMDVTQAEVVLLIGANPTVNHPVGATWITNAVKNGRPGTGLHPLRVQNNVQGASDAGLIPMMLPDYQHVSDASVRARFEKAWKLPEGTLDTQPGLTVVEVMHAIKSGGIRGMYVMGENPAMSDPDANHAREALAALDHLVVQDIFLTETAYLADVVLPASSFPEKTGSFTNTDRLVQMGRQAINPPGDAKQDLWIIQQIAQRLGLAWQYSHVSEVFDEMRRTMPSIGGITWDRLEREHAVTYPCVNEGDPGDPVVFTDTFPREGGRARFVPADIIPAAERPDTDYPMVLITGRQLEHWHTGSMTRRATTLDAIEPDPVALVHPLDLAAMGGHPGDVVTIESRRGRVELYARADEGSPRGAVFVPFCYYEAAINRLTNAALDPFAKIPEFKYCAIRVSLGGEAPLQGSYGGGQALRNILAASAD